MMKTVSEFVAKLIITCCGFAVRQAEIQWSTCSSRYNFCHIGLPSSTFKNIFYFPELQKRTAGWFPEATSLYLICLQNRCGIFFILSTRSQHFATAHLIHSVFRRTSCVGRSFSPSSVGRTVAKICNCRTIINEIKCKT